MFGPLKQNNGNSKATKKEGGITNTKSSKGSLIEYVRKIVPKTIFLSP